MELLGLNNVYLLLTVDVSPPRDPQFSTAANAALILAAGEGDSAELRARSRHSYSEPDSFSATGLIKEMSKF